MNHRTIAPFLTPFTLVVNGLRMSCQCMVRSPSETKSKLRDCCRSTRRRVSSLNLFESSLGLILARSQS